MNKTFKIALNILVFVLIAGFGYYMVHSMLSDGKIRLSGEGNTDNLFISPYRKTNSFKAASDIISFDIYENMIYAAQSGKVTVFDLSGRHQRDFVIKKEVRDIVVEESAIYLLYPAEIEVYTLKGEKLSGWQAYRKNSDYCAMTLSSENIYVTDAGNKNICIYTKEGDYLQIIISPYSFIIPSYSFDIINIQDTIYCSNSGRHLIESYTLEGKYIGSFGKAGTVAGSFAGCCNPAYLTKSTNGHILTSEKGNPRISCYGRDGKFRTILFDSKMLGGGTTACEMHVSGEDIFIANKKTISVYSFDASLAEESCAGCEEDCPLRLNL